MSKIIKSKATAYWNYRVLKKHYKDLQGGDQTYYEIHEVYYSRNDKPVLWTKDAINPFGETLRDLRGSMNLMRQAFKKPVLELRGKKRERLVELELT